MKLIDVKPNEVFIFSDDNYPFLRVNAGFCDLIPKYAEDEFYETTEENGKLAEEVIKVDRSLLWRKAMEYEIPQYVIEKKAKELLAKYGALNTGKPYVTRQIYFFTCINCNNKRQSYDREIASRKICKICKNLKSIGGAK